MLPELKSSLTTIETAIDRIRIYRRLASCSDFSAMPAVRHRFELLSK